MNVNTDDDVGRKDDEAVEPGVSLEPTLRCTRFRPTSRPSISQDEEIGNRSVTFKDASDHDEHKENGNRSVTFKDDSDHGEFFDCCDNSESNLSRKVQKLVDSGAIDDLLECFEEMKRLKKDQ